MAQSVFKNLQYQSSREGERVGWLVISGLATETQDYSAWIPGHLCASRSR
jgi:hypothetical protein